MARTTAVAFGALAGFSIDGLDDLRLLVDEVFGVMGTVGVQRVDVNLLHWGEGMRVEMAAASPVRGSPPDARIAVLLATVLGADVQIHLDGTRPTFEATLGGHR